MTTKDRPHILLTNDDGIRSPGLWAAAHALSELGWVTIAAPLNQESGMGRSSPAHCTGKVQEQTLKIGDEEWQTYSVDGSPAQVVDVAVLTILKQKPDLIVSGINYGENPTTDITMSGTVGAAIEAAAMGIPALASSLQLENISIEYSRHSHDLDFTSAGHFTLLMARMLLEGKFPPGVDLLNINVPQIATPQTPWHLTRLATTRYFEPILIPVPGKEQGNTIDVCIEVNEQRFPPGTDVHTFRIAGEVSVTPLTLDMTARLDLAELEKKLKGK